MINALAPGMRRGCSWVWLSFLLSALLGEMAVAQVSEELKKAASASAVTKPAAETDEAEAKADDAPIEDQKTSRLEVFEDPNAKKALEIFKGVSGAKSPRTQDLKDVLVMAEGGSIDRDKLQRFVLGMLFDLTDKGNINALLAPPDNRPSNKAVQRACDNLINAMQTARVAKNTAFLTAYNDVLLETLPKLFDNNLIARVQAMIILGQTGNPRAVPVFLKEIKNPDQTVWVKLWALRGLTNVTDGGKKADALGAQAIEAGRVVSDFLLSDADLPWPVQMRALEALGAMRQGSMPNSVKAEMASTAMKFLVDPQARPEVRAEAARTLGIVRISQAVKNYNYGLIAYNVGLLAAEIGEKANSSFDANRTMSEYMTGLLIAPIFQAFNGVEDARESGLLKIPGGAPNMNQIREISNLVSGVTKAAVELVRAPNGQVPNRKKILGDQVSALKKYLAKNSPKDFHLVPKGDEYRPANAEVAKATKAEKPGAGGDNGP